MNKVFTDVNKAEVMHAKGMIPNHYLYCYLFLTTSSFPWDRNSLWIFLINLIYATPRAFQKTEQNKTKTPHKSYIYFASIIRYARTMF